MQIKLFPEGKDGPLPKQMFSAKEYLSQQCRYTGQCTLQFRVAEKKICDL